MQPRPVKTSLYSLSMSSVLLLMLSMRLTSPISVHVLSPSTLGTCCSTTSNSTGVYFSLYSHAITVLPHALILWPPNAVSFARDFVRGYLLTLL